MIAAFCTFLIIVSACITYILISTSKYPSYIPQAFPQAHQSSHPKEAYVLYDPASIQSDYMDYCHLLTLFSLKTDTELRDPSNRDVVVMVTNQTAEADIQQLERAGAKIFRVPHSLRNVFPHRDSWPETYHYVWDKVWAFALTEYDRVLYMDSDMVFNRPIHPIWESRNSMPEHRLAATADWQGVYQTPMPDGPYFNSGFMMIRPDQQTFEEILRVDLSESSLQWPDQDLLNIYFSRDGPHPWVPLDHLFHSNMAKEEDLEAGTNVIQAKAWWDITNAGVQNLWFERMGRMRGWRMAKEARRKAQVSDNQ
ncbi:nucleotide-diphospho-sugar transferase [Dioszegia hungarica]|uniref:Nucleotide-diphospho-sugar transferase n=1 Tax=Dioszegia hungarica TaxID=4972 RepID=A0AA38H5Q0_9TREE|nr:nucleotide-diphospho-sugar transferase [Dioszegia hungarica]KAI9634640.1 nucleotide-diphospho-sugar transferase [Dioszegia hungarica]